MAVQTLLQLDLTVDMPEATTPQVEVLGDGVVVLDDEDDGQLLRRTRFESLEAARLYASWLVRAVEAATTTHQE